jgi:hypothetical protein
MQTWDSNIKQKKGKILTYYNYLLLSYCSLSQVLVLLILYSPFTTSMEERKRCYYFILSRTPHETYWNVIILFFLLAEVIFQNLISHLCYNGLSWIASEKPTLKNKTKHLGSAFTKFFYSSRTCGTFSRRSLNPLSRFIPSNFGKKTKHNPLNPLNALGVKTARVDARH